MANNTIEELSLQASDIRDADQDKENTALRVGTMLLNIIGYLSSLVTVDDANAAVSRGLSAYFSGGQLKAEALPDEFVQSLATVVYSCTTKESSTELLNLIHSRIILFDSMGSSYDGFSYTPVAGDIVQHNGYVAKWNGSGYNMDGAPPLKKHVIYVNKHTGKFYMWNGSAFEEVGNDYEDQIQISKMDQTDEANIPVGKLHYIPSQAKLVYRISSTQTWSWTPKRDRLYIDITDHTLYRWSGSSFQRVSVSDNVLIYNGLDKTTTGAALDASQGQFIGKLLNANDNAFYNVWVGTQQQLEALNGDYDDNTIYLVGTVPTVAQRFNVSFNGGSHTSIPANTPQTVKEGSAFSVVVSPADGYTIDSCYATMGNDTIQGVPMTGNDLGKYSITINNVTGAISIQAVATKHITEIEVSAGARNGNTIQLSATVKPTDADNVTLAWSISEDGTNYSNSTTHFVINSNGELTIKEGTNNASVTVKCADTNEDSNTAQGTLPLTGLSYESVPVPITEITDITATRTAANTLTLAAVTNPADANTPAVAFSLVGTVPTVKQVRRWAAGDTVDGEVKESAGNDLIELPAVELSGNTLTYKGDCQVTVKATAGNVESSAKTITITHDNGDAIWFEDSAVLSLLNTKGIGSGGKITYTQASAVTTFLVNNVQIFEGNTDIVRFNEFKHFTSITTIGMGASHKSRFNGCTNLEAIELPNTLGEFYGSSSTTAPFKGTKIKKLVVTKSGASIAQYSLSGMVLEELEATPSSIAKDFAGGTTTIKKITVKNTGSSPFVAQNFLNFSNLEEVDLGTGISALGSQLFRGCTKLKKLTLRYAGVVTSDNSFYGVTMSNIDLYVPSDQVSSYDSSSTWNGTKSRNAIIE